MSDLGKIDIQLDASAIPAPPSLETPLPKSQEQTVEQSSGVNDSVETKPVSNKAIPKDFDELASSIDGAEPQGESASTQDVIEDDTKKVKSKEENFSAMRKSLKAKEEEIEALRRDLEDKGGLELSAQEIKSKLEEYDNKVKQLEAERDELSNYKAASDITKTESYRREIADPMAKEERILLDTANQYGLTQEQLKEGLDARNLAELERTLTDYGMTPTGIMQVVNSVKNIHALRMKSHEMSKNSKQWLENLQKQDMESRNQLLNQISDTIEKSSKVIWDSTTGMFREDAVRGQFPYAQKVANNEVWNKAIESADNTGNKIYQEFLKDLESNIKNRTVTPTLLDKTAKLSFGYGHFILSQQSQMSLAKKNHELQERIRILEGDNPGMGGSVGYNSSSNGNKPSYTKSFEDIAKEV